MGELIIRSKWKLIYFYIQTYQSLVSSSPTADSNLLSISMVYSRPAPREGAIGIVPGGKEGTNS